MNILLSLVKYLDNDIMEEDATNAYAQALHPDEILYVYVDVKCIEWHRNNERKGIGSDRYITTNRSLQCHPKDGYIWVKPMIVLLTCMGFKWMDNEPYIYRGSCRSED